MYLLIEPPEPTFPQYEALRYHVFQYLALPNPSILAHLILPNCPELLTYGPGTVWQLVDSLNPLRSAVAGLLRFLQRLTFAIGVRIFQSQADSSRIVGKPALFRRSRWHGFARSGGNRFDATRMRSI